MELERAARPAQGARARILDVATELFYQQGVRAVGVDTVVARAGVAKASLYHHFRTKDELTAAVLRRRDERWREWLAETVDARARSGKMKLLAVFDALAEWFAAEEFRGCAFINAAAEFPDPKHPVRVAVSEHKRAMLGYLRDLAGTAPVEDPETLAAELFLLMEGATATAYVENATWPAGTARAAAEALLHRRS